MLLTVIVRRTHAGYPPLIKCQQGICWPFNRHRAGTKLHTIKDPWQDVICLFYKSTFAYTDLKWTMLHCCFTNTAPGLSAEIWPHPPTNAGGTFYCSDQEAVAQGFQESWNISWACMTAGTEPPSNPWLKRLATGHRSRCSMIVIGSCGEVSR